MFQGLRYVERSVGSAYIPKLLGTYERELAPQIEELCALNPDRIVDVGAAEGFYAVGLARRLPRTRVIAFEQEEAGREALRQMAVLNGVEERMIVRGRCEPCDLVDALSGAQRPVVVCDVEGYEATLLDLNAVPALERCTILVELHEFVVAGITEEVRNRFAASHRCHLIWQETRARDDFPWRTLYTTLLPQSYIDWAVSEWRPIRMSWLYLTPRRING